MLAELWLSHLGSNTILTTADNSENMSFHLMEEKDAQRGHLDYWTLEWHSSANSDIPEFSSIEALDSPSFPAGTTPGSPAKQD